MQVKKISISITEILISNAKYSDICFVQHIVEVGRKGAKSLNWNQMVGVTVYDMILVTE